MSESTACQPLQNMKKNENNFCTPRVNSMNNKYQYGEYVNQYFEANADDKPDIFTSIVSYANKGERQAESDLGYMYANGIGCNQNFRKALKWFLEASRHKLDAGIYNLGVAHQYGEGTVKNLEAALNCFNVTAKKGFLPSVLKLAIIKFRNMQVSMGPHLTKLLLDQPADQSTSESLFRYAICKMEGFGVKKKPRGAIAIMTIAAKRNYLPAQVFLRNFYLQESLIINSKPNSCSNLTNRQLMLIWNHIACYKHHIRYHDPLEHILSNEAKELGLGHYAGGNSSGVFSQYERIMKSIDLHICSRSN